MNNTRFDCPQLMSDGNYITDYRPNGDLNAELMNNNSICDSYQYRQFLQQNGDALMDKHREIACEQNCCGPCDEGREGFSDTMLPEKHMFVTDGRLGKMVVNNPNGIGTGRSYYTFAQGKDCEGIPTAWPKVNNNCVSPLDNFAYIGDNTQLPDIQRQAVPGGGCVLSGGDPRVNM